MMILLDYWGMGKTKLVLFPILLSFVIISISGQQVYAGPPSPPPNIDSKFGDMRCYNFPDVVVTELIELDDQFGIYPHQVIQRNELCAFAIKDPDNVFNPELGRWLGSGVVTVIDQHFNVYDITDPNPPVNKIVELTDQFGTTTHTVNQAVQLWVPAKKTVVPLFGNDPPTEFPNNSNDEHYKCYDITPVAWPYYVPNQPFTNTVNFHDQFTSQSSALIESERLCVPAEKILSNNDRFGDKTDPIHYKCYEPANKFSGSSLNVIDTEDQFINTNGEIIGAQTLTCIPATKRVIVNDMNDPIPPTVGGTAGDLDKFSLAIANPHLLVTNSDLVAMWIIPVIAGIGIGVFVLKKRN